MKETSENKLLYWNSRAVKYPRAFEPGTLRRTRAMIRLISSYGVDFRHKDFLDIGCGTGIYSLALARRCRSVSGVDSSEAMLRVFSDTAEERGIGNASCRKIRWAELPEEEVKKKYDIALASMTAAVRTEDDIAKMCAAAREYCVYIGWNGERRNPLLEEAYAHHGVVYKAPPGAETVVPLLRSAGLAYCLREMETSWTKNLSVMETAEDIFVNVRVNGAEPDGPWVMDFLRKRASGETVRQRTTVRKALIIWRPAP